MISRTVSQPRVARATRPASSPARPAPDTAARFAARQRPAWRAHLLSAIALLVLWQAVVSLLRYPAWLLPGPLDVLLRFRHALADGTLVAHIIPTLLESSMGFGLALVIGTLLGYLVAHSPRLERVLAPYLTAAQAIPVIAVAPLILIWFGYSSDVVRNAVIAAVVVLFPIFSSTLTGIRTIPKELREVGLVEGATRLQRLRYIELPLALPVLLSGIRTSLAYATTGAVVGEFIGSRYGLGALINVARGFFDTPLIFVALVCLGLITLLFYLMLRLVERLLATRLG